MKIIEKELNKKYKNLDGLTAYAHGGRSNSEHEVRCTEFILSGQEGKKIKRMNE
jgi:hypothetical protein